MASCVLQKFLHTKDYEDNLRRLFSTAIGMEAINGTDPLFFVIQFVFINLHWKFWIDGSNLNLDLKSNFGFDFENWFTISLVKIIVASY